MTALCEMCTKFPLGGYDWKCKRCLARAFVRAPLGDRRYTQRLWRESMPDDEYEEMKRLVAEVGAEIKSA